ncbi:MULTISPECIES: hypothetical protein [unclassified Streptomyces]|uniref:hypothetical protein n=1 Tax=unclassified Streptomyces TaxID=2593676 RepID=UPI000746DF5A|nr:MULTISPECIES: hypothetical protein [unclassified Streptomyces]KUL55030.1 hypothetical protein ADL30_14375 [Streptomyces sp. NRRL S-1521]
MSPAHQLPPAAPLDAPPVRAPARFPPPLRRPATTASTAMSTPMKRKVPVMATTLLLAPAKLVPPWASLLA